MSKNPRTSQTNLSRKHLDRLHREQRQTRLITIGAIVVIALVILVIAYGYLDQRYFRFMRTVAEVNNEKISANEFRAFTKYYRNNLIQNAESTYQLASMFGSDANALQSFGSQLVQIADELDPERAGNQAIDQLVQDKLIRQEAKKRGITVSPEEVETELQAALRYYANGTPTPTPTLEVVPTSTLSPIQQAMVPPTFTPLPTVASSTTLTATAVISETPVASPTPSPTVAATPVITVTPTALPTATPYTLEGYQNNYATLVANLKSVEIPEDILRYVIESRLIQTKLMDEVIGKVPCVADEVWAQHILVADENLAKDIRARALNGEDWFKLAAEYSTDTSNKDQGGDLGWFGAGKMVPEFEKAAFGLNEPGQISEPVQTQFGWHIIRLVAREQRPITGSDCERLPADKFQKWVDEQRANSDVQIFDNWVTLVPLNPTLPADIQDVVNGLKAANNPTENFATPVP